MATIASFLEHKTYVESNNLKHKLRNQLYEDIHKLYSEAIFADVFINVEDNVIKSHRCILQTRVPAFYNTYANRPDLINFVPVSKLGFFFREVYKESAIRQQEEEILKCIDSCFVHDNSSASTSISDHDGVDSKQRLLQDLSRVSALNAIYLRTNTDNSVYYSLVDRSLVLSDYSDINEEAPDMSGGPEQAKTSTLIEPDTSERERNQLVQEPVCKRENVGVVQEQPHSKAIGDARSIRQGEGKKYKCFIDASDLIDEGDVESLKSSGEPVCDSLNGDSDITSSEKLSIVVDANDDVSKLKRTCVLVEEHDQRRAASDRVVVSSSCEQTKNYLRPLPSSESHTADVVDVAEKAQIRITEPRSPDTTSSASKLRTREPEQSTCSEMVSSTERSNVEEAFSLFKTHLKVKYECARSNHTYTDAELDSLKAFDELLSNDSEFQFLRRNLEGILTVEQPSKTQIAVHKFLVKQYEKRFGAERTAASARSLMWDLLKRRSSETDAVDGADNDDLLKKLLSQKLLASKTTSRKFEPARESVTNSKSCGFFIDLKDNAKPVARPETKEKSPLPPKQLFSMFIDFGNSTDSDSSFDAQSKFERRKKQHMSKMEKSRDLRTSVTSLNEVAAEKVVPSAGADVAESAKTSDCVVRRGKLQTAKPNELRRSWNVDKTSELNLCTPTRYKRSSSVTEQYARVQDSVKPESNEQPPVPLGNADSTNELTVNGESEISTNISHSEVEEGETNSMSKSSRCETQTLSQDESSQKVEENTFVRLSDLDNQPKSLTSSGRWPSTRMTKSVTGVECNWLETKLLNNSANSRSLSRIFPDLGASVLSKTNSDVDDTTVSSISSVVSTCESNLELSSLTNKVDNHSLGQDLLRMFVDEISTDVVVEVAGRRIKAHKCILTSRCQYFAALLSGGWVESAGNVLSILGFSYNVVYFALRYIYSGESEIPDNINIVELATLADYLCLEGLKEIVSSTLKTKYCHFFHKPCNVCSVGVLECLPIAMNYGLDDLHRKSLRWITKHYVRLWCTKAFASLSWDLIDKCFNQHVVNMTVDNVFETLMNCDKLFSVIPQTRWAEPCFVVTKKLHDSCIKYLSNHFVDFLKSDSFTSIASNRTWGIVIMDEKAQHVCAKMRTDGLCQSYAYISEQHKLATATHENEELIELLSRVKNQIETALVKVALQASQSSAWFQMGPELRSHIQSSAGLTFIPNEAKRRPEALKPRQSLVASSGSRTVDLAQVKSAINRQHRQNNVRTSEPRESRSSAHQRQAALPPRSSSVRQNGVQNKENKASCNSISSSSRSPYRNKYANVKSRYMDRKNDKEDKVVSETTPSETSEAEKSSITSKRSSKSLVSSVHLSPAIRQTARAVSLSKIPVSVRNSSRVRNESDRDTTSGSDSGVRSNRPKVNGVGGESATSSRNAKKMVTSARSNGASSSLTQSAVMRRSLSGSDRTRNGEERTSSRGASRSYTKTTQSASAKVRTVPNGTRSVSSAKENGRARCGSASRERASVPAKASPKDSSPDTKCPSDRSSKSNSSSSEAMVAELPRRPDIPFRRDGTFCIEEPTMLKKRMASSDHADIV